MWHASHLGQDCPLCCLGRDLKAIAERLDHEPYKPEIVRTRASWSGNQFLDFIQQDVDDAMMLLSMALEKAESKVPSPGLPGSYWQLLAHTSEELFRCTSCGAAREQTHPTISLTLPLPNETTSVDELLKSRFGNLAFADGDKSAACPAQCNKTPAQVQRFETVTQWPPVLILTLMRFKTTDNNELAKLNTKMLHAERLFLEDQTIHYRLYGVVVHHGSALRVGHYTAYVREAGDSWLHCDDEQTPRVVLLQEVLDAQAYLLLYQRERLAEDAPLVEDVQIL